MKNKKILIAYKLFFGLLGFSAIITEVATLIERGRFMPANFFSFFTIESNIFATAILILSALVVAGSVKSKVFTMLRGAATLYMVTTGIVFAVLLSGIENAIFTAVSWDNIVLHYIMPIAVLVDWLIDRPKIRIGFKQALVWIIFPLVYVVYSLVRGSQVDWYPYPFLDPDTNGYGGVAITSILIALMSLLLIWVLTRISAKHTTKAQS